MDHGKAVMNIHYQNKDYKAKYFKTSINVRAEVLQYKGMSLKLSAKLPARSGI